MFQFLILFFPFSENSYLGPNVFSSLPRIIRMIKPRRMRCAWHVACTGAKKGCIYDTGGKARRTENTKMAKM
jgi:hypothetical protein